MRTAPSPKVRRRMLMQASVGLLVLAIYILAAWFLSSAQFHRLMRNRIVSQLEEVTGGRVELSGLSWTLSTMEFQAEGLTIHGLEAADQIPYLHAERVNLSFKIAPLSRTEIGLRFLSVDDPVFHLIVYPDGHTNQPTPKRARDNKNTVQRIFDLAIDRAEVHNGQVILNERRLPLEFAGNNVHAIIDRDPSANTHYDGSLQIDNIRSRYSTYLPLSASAKLDFGLFPNLLQLKSARIISGGSFLQAEGVLQDFPDPHINLTYTSNLEAAQLAAFGLQPQLNAGTLQLAGSGKYGAGQFSTTGRVTAQNLGVTAGSWRGSHMDAVAAYSIDNRDLKLSNLVARVMGGIATGSIEITNWRSPASASVRAREVKEPVLAVQAGVVKLHLERVPLSSAADAISSRNLPLNELRLSGNATGNVEAVWRGSATRSNIKFQVAVTPPPQANPGEMPLTAQVAGTYDFANDAVNFNELNATAPGLSLRSEGKLAKSGNLQVNVAVSDFARLGPVLKLVGSNQSWLTSIVGTLSFNGTLTGTLRAPSVSGHMQVKDVTIALAQLRQLARSSTAPPASAASDKLLHFDSVSGDISYSTQSLIVRNGQIARLNSQAAFDLNAGLVGGKLLDSSSFSGHLMGRGGDLNDLQKIFGYDYPLSGIVAGNLAVSGTKSNPHVDGRVQISNVRVFGENVRSFAADLKLADREVSLENFTLLQSPGSIAGAGSYSFDTDAIHFDLKGTNLSLANIQHLHTDHVQTTGTVNFNSSGSGSLKSPIINATASVGSLVVNGQQIGEVNLQAVTSGDSTKIVARSNFKNALFNVDGTIRLGGDFPVSGSVEFSKFDLSPLIHQLLPNAPAGTSSLQGNLKIDGPLRKWREIQIQGEIPQFSATYAGLKTEADGPTNFSIDNSILRFQRFRLVGEDTEINLRGSLELAGERQMNGRVDGRFNMKLLQTLDRDINSSGLVTFGVNLSGDAERPLALGQIQIQNGAVSLIDLPNGLSEINGSLALSQDRVQIQNLTAKTGGGEVTLGGFANLTNPFSVNLTVNGRDIRLRYPQGVSSTADLRLAVTGTLQNSTLSGDVLITKFGLTPQFDLASLLARIKKPAELPRPDSPVNTLHLDIGVTSTPELRVQTSLARLSGDVDLRLRGTAAKPSILGRVNVNEGQISFNGQNYRLERGDVTFTNPVQVQPVIDFEATTRVQEYDITLGFHGPADRLSTNYRSDPPLPEADIISLLAFGRTREDTALAANTTTTFSDSVSSAILGQAITSAVGNRMQRLFGVSHIRISPELSGVTDNNPNAQVSIEQQVSDKVTITYVTYVSQASQQSIQVEYNVNRNVSIVGARDQYGVFSFDVRLRQRKR